MKILILGGTAWLGGSVATAALAAGHEVTCLARGANVPEGAEIIRADRNELEACNGAKGTQWDAVIDVATSPGHVRRSVRDLAECTDRYLYVSSASVYKSLAIAGVNESAELHLPLPSDEMATIDQYGSAKAACEQAVQMEFGPDRAIILRPGLIGGPGDPTGRTSYWPLRFAESRTEPDQVLTPDVPRQPVSVIDVRDLARWIVALLEAGTVGVFNASGDTLPLKEYLATARTVSEHRGQVTPVPSDWLIEQGVAQWVGARSLPLWIADPTIAGLGAVSNARAKQAGLSLRPVAETMRDTIAWAHEAGINAVNGAGLSAAEEQNLLSTFAEKNN